MLFADLIGAQELYATAGDGPAQEAIARGLEKLRQAATDCGAQVLKRIGSRLMVLAASADAAASAAVAMHEAARGFPATAGSASLGLGVGFHFGPVIRDQNDDVFGDTVNLAARLVEQAARGQILFAAETANELGATYRRFMRSLYALPLKGRAEDVSLCELVWRSDEPQTFLPFAAPKPREARLTLRFHGEVVELRDGAESLTIGRGSDCGLVVNHEQASRHHCTIRQRGDHFVLADRSSNGTYVTLEGEGETRLERDELILRKRGWIAIGGRRGSGVEAVEFYCD